MALKIAWKMVLKRCQGTSESNNFQATSESGVCVPSDVFNNTDILAEILVRVPPEFICTPILVSKHWLQLIRNPSFREYYIRRWSHTLPFAGFIGFYARNADFFRTPISQDVDRVDSYHRETYDWENAHRFWSTCKEGNDQQRQGDRIFGQDDYIIDSSPNGILLIGRQSYPFTFIVWNPYTQKHHHLPQPRENYRFGCIAFEVEYCGNGLFHYKVTRVKGPELNLYLDATYIQTFSSRRGTWEETTLPGFIDLFPSKTGIAIGGVIHWVVTDGGIGVYDPNRRNQPLAYIRSPASWLGQSLSYTGVGYAPKCYGVSGEGLLQCASTRSTGVEVRVLHTEQPGVYSTYSWSFRYKVEYDTLRRDLGVCQGPRPMLCVSFLPRNSDYLFMMLGLSLRERSRIFLLHFPTQKWQEVAYENEPLSEGGYRCWEAIPYFKWQCPWPDHLANTSL